jgi:hypothetical protein
MLALLAVAQILWLVASARLFPPVEHVLTLEDWKTHVALHGFLLIVLILFSYGWFGTFFQMEGKRDFAAHTEIELASRIRRIDEYDEKPPCECISPQTHAPPKDF